MDSKDQDHHQNESDVQQQPPPPQTSQGHPMFHFNHSPPSASQFTSIDMGIPTNAQQQPQIMLDTIGDMLHMPVPGMHSQGSNTPPNSQIATGGTLAYSPQVLLDKQYRLTQLQQLQYLQQQIFQQQIALLSGPAPNLLNAPSTSTTFEHQGGQSFTVNGLPTPAPSGELRPQQQSLDFMSPMVLNAFVDSMSQPPGVHHTHHAHQSLPSSPLTHSMPDSIINSPAFLGNGNSQPQSPAIYSPYLSSGPLSAPEYTAFQTSPSQNGLSPPNELDLDISPLTSPWLGAQSNQQMALFQNQNQMSQHQQRIGGSHSQYHSTPLTGPISTPNIMANIHNNNNKRSASPTTGETDARKKQSPAVRPTNTPSFSPLHDPQPPATRRGHRPGNRSTSSRAASSRQRKGSTAPDSISETPGDSPSPVDLSMPPPAPPPPPNPALLPSAANSLSSLSAVNPENDASYLKPVTPASIMNLDVNGGRLKVVTTSTGATNTTGAAGGMPSPVSSRSKRGVQGGIGSGTPLISPSLKPILPSNGNTPTTPISPASANPSPSSRPAAAAGGPSSSYMLPPIMRKTSHKAAEQKRRDSLKTTFDELRGLLPPIPLPSASGGQGGDEDGATGTASNGTTVGGAGAAPGIVFGNTVKPLLPGALPPRGPPKAGGEGPNKAVSKLQLLICGNEYIRTLQGRVERRDEEIGRLRDEVRKMRQLMAVLSTGGRAEEANLGSRGGAAGSEVEVELATSVEELMAQLDLGLDLDRDLDAVEKMALTSPGGRRDDMSNSRMDMATEEDPGDYDDD